MAVKYHVTDIFVNKFLQRVEKSSYCLCNINIAVSVAKIFNALFAVGVQYILNAKPFCPVHRVNNKSFAYLRILLYILNVVCQHCPRCWLVFKAIDVEISRAALCINKKRLGELCCKGGFSYPLGTVNNYLLPFADDAVRNFNVHINIPFI